MAKMTPEIRDQLLFCYPDPMPVCPVESPAWFAWLETASAFRFAVDSGAICVAGMARCMDLCLSARSNGGRWGCGMPIAGCMAFCTSGMWSRRG